MVWVWSTNTLMSRNFTLPALIISLWQYKLQYQIHSPWTCLFFVVHLPPLQESIFHFMALPFSQEVCNLLEEKTESYSTFCLTFVRQDIRFFFHKDLPSTALLPLETWVWATLLFKPSVTKGNFDVCTWNSSKRDSKESYSDASLKKENNKNKPYQNPNNQNANNGMPHALFYFCHKVYSTAFHSRTFCSPVQGRTSE